MSVSSVCKSVYQSVVAFGAKAVNAISQGASFVTAKVSSVATVVFQNKIAMGFIVVGGVLLAGYAIKKICSKGNETADAATEKKAETTTAAKINALVTDKIAA
jgi:hypothetical protein